MTQSFNNPVPYLQAMQIVSSLGILFAAGVFHPTQAIALGGAVCVAGGTITTLTLIARQAIALNVFNAAKYAQAHIGRRAVIQILRLSPTKLLITGVAFLALGAFFFSKYRSMNSNTQKQLRDKLEDHLSAVQDPGQSYFRTYAKFQSFLKIMLQTKDQDKELNLFVVQSVIENWDSIVGKNQEYVTEATVEENKKDFMELIEKFLKASKSSICKASETKEGKSINVPVLAAQHGFTSILLHVSERFPTELEENEELDQVLNATDSTGLSLAHTLARKAIRENQLEMLKILEKKVRIEFLMAPVFDGYNLLNVTAEAITEEVKSWIIETKKWKAPVGDSATQADQQEASS